LVVEDEEDIRNIVKVMFGVWGHNSIEFRDGNQAFKWLDEIEAGTYKGELPELALMDIRMPGPRGNEIARRMRTLTQFQAIPIVLMTAFSLNEAERQAMLTGDGVDHIVAKPLPEFYTLKQLLEDVCTKKKSSAPAPQATVAPASAPQPAPQSAPQSAPPTPQPAAPAPAPSEKA
jgi:CheY-like chemotaxis protein